MQKLVARQLEGSAFIASTGGVVRRSLASVLRALSPCPLALGLSLSVAGAALAYEIEGPEAAAFDVVAKNDPHPNSDPQLKSAEYTQGGALPLALSRPLPVRPKAIDLTVRPDNLWHRIQQGFSMPDLEHELVTGHEAGYLRYHGWWLRTIERSRPYLFFIVEEIERRGMPMEIALLPMVESAYNPLARSPAKAVGLWQFIPATGKDFLLKQNWWRDQRRDIIASTRSALDYLQYIYELHGDWHLALASYNCGEGAVTRAVKKNIKEGLPTDFKHLELPDETRNYVPRLQALKNIFNNPELLAKLKLPAIPNEAYFTTQIVDHDLDLNLAARFAGMSLKKFFALNASHRRLIIRAGNSIVLPTDLLHRFQEGLAAHRGAFSSWRIYTPKVGERLDQLAQAFGLRYSDLKRINGFRGKKSDGRQILLPKKDSDIQDVHASIAALPILSMAKPKAKKRSTKYKRYKKARHKKYRKHRKARVKKRRVKKAIASRHKSLKSRSTKKL